MKDTNIKNNGKLHKINFDTTDINTSEDFINKLKNQELKADVIVDVEGDGYNSLGTPNNKSNLLSKVVSEKIYGYDDENTNVSGALSILNDNIKYIYDTIIDNQTDFDAMIADETWLGARNVLLVGGFVINSDITVPNICKFNGNNCNITSSEGSLYTLNFEGGTSVEDINFNNVNIYGVQLINNCKFTGDRFILSSSKNINNISVETAYAKFDGCTNIRNSNIHAGIENELEAMFYNCAMLINNNILFKNKAEINYTIYNECSYLLKCFFQSGKVPLSTGISIPKNIKLYVNCSDIMDTSEQPVLFEGAIKTGTFTLTENVYNFRMLVFFINSAEDGIPFGNGILPVLSSSPSAQTVIFSDTTALNSHSTYMGKIVRTSALDKLQIAEVISNVSHKSGSNHTGGSTYFIRKVIGIR